MSDGQSTTTTTRRPQLQLYADGAARGVRWRLLSRNRRDMGRSVAVHRDTAECEAAIADLLARRNGLEIRVERTTSAAWRFLVSSAGDDVAMSAHPFPRRIRCEQAGVGFLQMLEDAEIGDRLLIRPGGALAPVSLLGALLPVPREAWR